MEASMGHHVISLVTAVAAVSFGIVILRKRLHRRVEYLLCVVSLFLFGLAQVMEIFGGVAEHLFADIFKLAPMILLVLFGLRQGATDRVQSAAIEKLRRDVERLEGNTTKGAERAVKSQADP